jgi:hypothetical protein
MKAWFLAGAMGALAGCVGISESAPGTVTGRIVTRHTPPERVEFSFSGKDYVERSLRIDAGGGLADASVFLEGPPSAPWVSGRVTMAFGPRQFEPRLAFVSPGEPVEIGDTRDDNKHELVVNLKGLESHGYDRVHTNPERPTPAKGPDRVCFTCPEGVWKREGKQFVRGRTVDVTFDREALVPLDWD